VGLLYCLLWAIIVGKPALQKLTLYQSKSNGNDDIIPRSQALPGNVDPEALPRKYRE
jgi:hypothetical protein